MSDRIKGYVVVLEENMREDDAQAITNAIKMVKGVLTVQPVIGGIEDVFTEERVRRELGEKLLAVLYPKK